MFRIGKHDDNTIIFNNIERNFRLVQSVCLSLSHYASKVDIIPGSIYECIN